MQKARIRKDKKHKRFAKRQVSKMIKLNNIWNIERRRKVFQYRKMKYLKIR